MSSRSLAATRTKVLLALALTVSLLACIAAPAGAKSCHGRHWVGAWAASPSDGAGGPFANQTLRMNVTPLLGGATLRVRLSNRFGRRAVTFDSVYIGKQQSGAVLVPGSNHRVLFRGRRKVTIPAGEEAKSDRVRLRFAALQHLAISVYASKSTGNATEHFQATQTSFVTGPATGNHSAGESGGAFTQPTTSRFFVSGIDVRAPMSTSAVVTFGDSITDGYQAPPSFPRDLSKRGAVDEDARYPDFLARRLAASRQSNLSVLNAGISGNRILRGNLPAFGPAALSRFRADVGGLSGVSDVIVLEGINDLSFSATSEAVIRGLRRLVRGLERLRSGSARRKRLRVLVGTILPASIAPIFDPSPELANIRRNQINKFIRTSGLGEGVVDFDLALRDPAKPAQLNPVYDSGDHLHPNSAGYQRMAEAVHVSKFQGPRCRFRRRL